MNDGSGNEKKMGIGKTQTAVILEGEVHKTWNHESSEESRRGRRQLVLVYERKPTGQLVDARTLQKL